MRRRTLVKPGDKFGRLIVERFVWRIKARRDYFQCLCECGERTIVEMYSITTGNTKSCGCLKKELMVIQGRKSRKHGLRHTPEYSIWAYMKKRCYNSNDHAYKNYGGRGIRVCSRWASKHGFVHFFKDMGPRPKGLTLDRKDNDGNYEPDNCRWATWEQQRRNCRRNRVLEFKGKKECVAYWMEKTKLARSTIFNRLKRGWSVERTLSEPIKGKQ